MTSTTRLQLTVPDVHGDAKSSSARQQQQQPTSRSPLSTVTAVAAAATTASENVLDFSNAYYGDDKCAEIVERARAAPFPTALDLRGNRFEVAGAKVLADLLRSQHNIVSLSLEWNNVGVLDQGVEALAAALEVDTQLLALDLRNNNIGPEGAKALAKALAHNRSLRRLDLRWNDIGNAGVLAFREALQSNHSLLTLELMGNNSSMKHTEEIEKLLVRNRALQGQPPLPQQQPSPAKSVALPPADSLSSASDTFQLEATRHTADQLLLQILAEKEGLESDLALAKKETRKLTEQLEEREQHVQMLRTDVTNLKDDRERYQTREADARRECHALTMQLDALENRRKLEFDEYRAARTALERDASGLREKLNHAEALQSTSLAHKSALIAELEDRTYSQESELHRLGLSTKALEDDVAKLHKQLLDAHKDAEKREHMLTATHASAIAALQRQHELETSALATQLQHATRTCDEQQNSNKALQERNEHLQATALQATLTHERELTELKTNTERELVDRVARAVGSVEAQVADVKRARLLLERDVAMHVATIQQLRDEAIALQQRSDDRDCALRSELEQQSHALQDARATAAQTTTAKARSDEQVATLERRLAVQDTRLVRLQETCEERLQEMAATAAARAQALTSALAAKTERIAALEREQLQLERAMSQQRHDLETRFDGFADAVTRFVQVQVANERAQRTDAHTSVAATAAAVTDDLDSTDS